MLACLVLLQLLFQEQDGYGCVEDQSISPAEYTAIGIKFITFVRIYFRLMSLVFHPMYSNWNIQFVTITKSIVYLDTRVLVEIKFSHFSYV